ncbi:MAG: phosphate ABC transporter substrate-binding protein, partial [Elusimicrobia bacterium]|nr:phosphate ABC transporter substrate-binding protein [Elusimicrobiota bacterium]
VQVTGGGSGTGIAALINGSTDICAASRPMKDQEKQAVQQRHGQAVKEIPAALDGVAIFLYQDNPVEVLTLAQVKAIYTGKVTRWSEVGGQKSGHRDQIIVYGRENNSGTYLYFKEHVLGNENFAPFIQSLPGTAAVINAVSKDPHAIGYGGIAYAKGVKAIKVKRDERAPAVEPSLATVESGHYPISRSLYFYTVGVPQGAVKAFIDWVLSDEGQKTCEAVGYYPLRKATPRQ